MKLMLNMPLKILKERWYYKNTERPTSQMPFTMKNHNVTATQTLLTDPILSFIHYHKWKTNKENIIVA